MARPSAAPWTLRKTILISGTRSSPVDERDIGGFGANTVEALIRCERRESARQWICLIEVIHR
jgi:hypothetical protein